MTSNYLISSNDSDWHVTHYSNFMSGKSVKYTFLVSNSLSSWSSRLSAVVAIRFCNVFVKDLKKLSLCTNIITVHSPHSNASCAHDSADITVFETNYSFCLSQYDLSGPASEIMCNFLVTHFLVSHMSLTSDDFTIAQQSSAIMPFSVDNTNSVNTTCIIYITNSSKLSYKRQLNYTNYRHSALCQSIQTARSFSWHLYLHSHRTFINKCCIWRQEYKETEFCSSSDWRLNKIAKNLS